MDFNFTEEQGMLRDSLAKMIRDQYDFETRRKVVASADGWRKDMWMQFAELGLMMAPFSEEDGGLGGGPIDAMVVMEEFGKGLVVEPYVPSVVCGGGFIKRGTDAQKEEYLTGIMSGETIFAFAYAEPRGRYNLADLETTAKKDGEGFVINGHKAVVIGAPWATHLIVTARTSGGRRDANGVTVFVVEKTAPGVSTRDYPTVDGRRASEVYFENVAVGAEAVIGEVDNGLPLIELVSDEAIAALCAEACGAMKVAHEMTVEYSRQRKQFGTADRQVPGAAAPHGRHVHGVRAVEVAHVHGHHAPRRGLRTGGAEGHLRLQGAGRQVGRFVGQQAVQLHGGMGMTEELHIGHYFKRLTMIDSEFGNVDHHLKRYTDLSAADVPVAAE
jgi:alkylation response protein AidB-like acyl-CoA dehydrogenase